MEPSPSKSPSSSSPSISSSFKLSPRFWTKKNQFHTKSFPGNCLLTSNSIWASDLGIVPVPFLSKHLRRNNIIDKSWKFTWMRLQFERHNFSPSQSCSGWIKWIKSNLAKKQTCSSCPADQEASESRTHLGRFEWSGPRLEDLQLNIQVGDISLYLYFGFLKVGQLKAFLHLFVTSQKHSIFEFLHKYFWSFFVFHLEFLLGGIDPNLSKEVAEHLGL